MIIMIIILSHPNARRTVKVSHRADAYCLFRVITCLSVIVFLLIMHLSKVYVCLSTRRAHENIK